jgi:tetratricopeptide (TPR) repeat protein
MNSHRSLFMRALPLLYVVSTLALGISSRLLAQDIVLKDGNHINALDITFGDGKITRTITLPDGKKGQSSLSFADIDHMEWQDPQELQDARNLLSQGKTQEALAALEKAKAFFKPLKAIKGNPYNDILFAQLEALDQAGDFDTLIRVLPESNTIKVWDPTQQMKLRIIKLNVDRRTSSDTDGILSQAEGLLADTTDSAIAARLWMTIGDIHTKTEHWEDALNAYLHVPVFYGTQVALVPQAELMAARSLASMERFKDAGVMFQRIAEAYPGSEIAATAKKEFLTVNGRDNKPDKPPQKGNDSSSKTPSKS